MSLTIVPSYERYASQFYAYPQLSEYPKRDPLYILETSINRDDSSLFLPDLLLLSCCYGMGIGTVRDEERALAYSVKAGLKGYVPAILTAVSLFEVYQPSKERQSGVQGAKFEEFAGFPMVELQAIIQRWKDGNWDGESIQSLNEIDTARQCGPSLPMAFTETSAARRMCRSYSNIRAKICTVPCTFQGVLAERMHSLHSGCGWQLLDVLASKVQVQASGDIFTIGSQNYCSQLNLLESFTGIGSTAASFEGVDGCTLLHYVAASLNWDQQTLMTLIDILLSLRVDSAFQSHDIASLIVLAVRAGNGTVALHLLKKDAALSVNDLEKICCEAILAGEWIILRELLKMNAQRAPIERVSVDGLLMYLCSIPRFHRDITGVDCFSMAGLDIMVEHGANINYCDARKRNPLMVALKAGNSDFANYLLERIKSNADETMVSLDTTPLLHRQVLREKVLKDLNAIDDDGENALSDAIRVGNVEMILALLLSNVDIEWEFDGYQLSALQVACQTSRYIDSSKTVERLLAHGTKALDIQDERGNTILHYLAFGTHGLDTERAMENLLKCSGSTEKLVNKANKEGQTPLQFAVSAGVVVNVKFLLKSGANVDAVDIRGYTALHLATDELRENNYEILDVLLNSGCDEYVLNLQDQWGRTALMHAVGKFPPIYSYGKCMNALNDLLTKGASVEIQDNWGQNALHHYYGRKAEIEFEKSFFFGNSIIILCLDEFRR